MTETSSDRLPSRALSSSLSPRSSRWTYTARSDSEAALERLVTLVRSGATRIAIEGAAGTGKTLLLHVLPTRLGSSFASAYLPHPGLGPAGVRAWLENFAAPLPADAGSTFEDLAFAYARRGPGLVLLIDDANAMPEAIAREFSALLERTGDALRIVVAGVPNPSFDAVLAALGGRVPCVRIGAPSAPSESVGIRDGALTQLVRAPNESAPSEALTARAEPHAPSAPSPAIEPDPARPRTPPSVASPPAPPADATARPPAGATELLPAHASTAGETERGAARTSRSASAPALRSLPRPSRSALRRAAGIAGVVAAAAAGLVLLLPRSDTRDELPTVASPPPAVARPPSPLPVAAAPPVPVHVNARPWARIFVDGRELGVTPLGNVPIAPGLRRFRAELADGRVVEREVRVEAADQKVTFP
jgi:hypothetical protein